MGRIAIDAGAAMEVTCGTEKGLKIRTLLLEGDEVLSSELLRLDMMDELAQYMRMHAISRDTAEECMNLLWEIIDQMVPFEEVASEAFSEAVRSKLPIYELLYFCIARRSGATLFTTDEKLATLCRQSGVDCRLF